MRTALPLLALCLISSACRGTAPALNGTPERGISAVIIGGRFVIPAGEARSAQMAVNLEGEGADGETYRLRILPKRPMLYQIEPGSYRLSPTRTMFGTPQAELKVVIQGRSYRARVPREILRQSAVSVKPRRIVALGVIEAKLSAAAPGQQPTLAISFDDSITTRRRLVETVIHNMMDSSVPADERESAIAWTRALDLSLQELSSTSERAPLYKLSP